MSKRLMQPPMLCPMTTIFLCIGNRFVTASSSRRKIIAEYEYG